MVTRAGRACSQFRNRQLNWYIFMHVPNVLNWLDPVDSQRQSRKIIMVRQSDVAQHLFRGLDRFQIAQFDTAL